MMPLLDPFLIEEEFGREPLSPFLFVIMAEGLSHSIKDATNNGFLKGLSLRGFHPPVSHIQLIDDTMLMGAPTVRESHFLQRVINDISEASGTLVNTDKS